MMKNSREDLVSSQVERCASFRPKISHQLDPTNDQMKLPIDVICQRGCCKEWFGSEVCGTHYRKCHRT
jgi:hypothetical protein